MSGSRRCNILSGVNSNSTPSRRQNAHPCRLGGGRLRFLRTGYPATGRHRSLVLPLCVLICFTVACAVTEDAPEERKLGKCSAASLLPDEDARQVTRELTLPLDFDPADIGNPLPVLVVDTLDKDVVDEPKIDGVLTLFDTLDGDLLLQTDIGIELRGGNYSMAFPKKQFGVVTRDADGKKVDVPLLGMPEDDDWVLSSTPIDRTMMRNHLAYALGRLMGLKAPETRHVELLLNQSGGPLEIGDYLGLYVLTEKLTRNPSRLGIDVDGGGFLVELTTTDAVRPDEPHFCAAWAEAPVIVHYPKKLTPESAQFQAVEQRIYDLEDAIFSSESSALQRILDQESAVDYWLLNNVLLNEDAFVRSVFLYSPDGERLFFGPAWDFDIAMRLSQAQLAIHNSDEYQWGMGLLKHKFFRQALTERWHLLRQDLLTDAAVSAMIDETWETIADAALRNDSRWAAVLSDLVDGMDTPAEKEKDQLHAWLIDRFNWVDDHIDDAVD